MKVPLRQGKSFNPQIVNNHLLTGHTNGSFIRHFKTKLMKIDA